MTRSDRIWIPGRLPGLNDFIYAKHHFQRAALKKEGSDRVGMVVLSMRLLPYAGVVDISVECREPNKRRDKDNVIGGAWKCCLDGLGPHGAALISNDGWKQIGKLSGWCVVDKANPGVMLTVTEAS